MKDYVLSCLNFHVGRKKAISMESFADNVGISTRYLQRIIAELITDGHPIGSSCSHPTGYWILNTVEEFDEADRNLNSRIVALAKRRRALRKHRATLAGQLELKGD